MDFDHREPHKKNFRITAGGAMLRNRLSLLGEIDQCDVVCANCHRIRTWRRHEERAPAPTATSRDLPRRRAYWRAQALLLDELRRAP
jgi:hypothetical protein